MSEKKLRWSDRIDDSIKTGNPYKAFGTALITYYPATIEMMFTKGERTRGLGLFLLSLAGFPIAVIYAPIMALTKRHKN